MVTKDSLTIFGLGHGRRVVPSQYVISIQSELRTVIAFKKQVSILWRSAAGGSCPLAASPSVLLQVHRRRRLVLVPLPQDGGQHQVEQRLEQSVHVVARLGARLEAHGLRRQAALLVQALVAQQPLVQGHRVLADHLLA